MKTLTLTLLLCISMLGCASFDDKVQEMREQAELCPGQVKFIVSSKDDVEFIKYMCDWDQEDSWS